MQRGDLAAGSAFSTGGCLERSYMKLLNAWQIGFNLRFAHNPYEPPALGVLKGHARISEAKVIAFD